MRRALVLLSCLLFLPFLTVVMSDCVPAQCDHGHCVDGSCFHGSCIDGSCQCEPNYGGADCSLPYETCEDGDRTCYNGSECVRNNHRDPTTQKYKYHCDCTKAYGVSPFAGLQCRQAATEYCVEGRSHEYPSEYAFCTNGGTCSKIVVHGTPHPGCDCKEDFEGMHCQYRKGEEPEEDMGQPYMMYAQQGGSKGGGAVKGIVIFFIVLVSLSVIGFFGYVVYQKKQREGGKEETATPPTSPDASEVPADKSEAEII